MKKAIIAILVALATSFWSCDEDPVGLSLPNAELSRDTLYATFDESVPIEGVISTLSSNRLLLGSNSGYTMRPILRFSPLPTNIVSIDSAFIEFEVLQSSGVGSGTTLSFTASGYPVVKYWETDTSAAFDNYPVNIDLNSPLGSMAVNSGDTAAVFVFSNPDIVRMWASDTTDSVANDLLNNKGMVLDFTNSLFIQELQAREAITGVGPSLNIIYQNTDGETDTSEVLAGQDAFLFEGDFVRNTDRTQTSTLTPWASLYTFDIDSINRRYNGRAIVESAYLQLPIDTSNSVLNSDFGPNLIVVPFISPVTLINKVEVDTSFTGFPFIASRVIDTGIFDLSKAYVETDAGLERRDFALNYIQRELASPTDTTAFTGLYIAPRITDEVLQQLSFFRYNDPDPQRRPRLIIESLVLPEERL